MLRPAVHRVTRIALTESLRVRGTFDKRALVLLLVLGAVTGAFLPHLTSGGLDFDHGLHRAHVDPDSPVYPAVVEAPVFRLVTVSDPEAAVESGEIELALVDGLVYSLDTDKGNAALAALQKAAQMHTHRLMLEESDEHAAFPVRVDVTYLAPSVRPERGAPGADAQEPDPDAGDDGDASADERDDEDAQSGGTASDGEPATPDAEAPDRGFDLFPESDGRETPGTLSPPFPFRSLILAYLFLIPMNFVVQVYAGSVIGERIGRQGEALLASPARPWEIITGKTLPYFVGMMTVSAAIAAWVGGGWLTLLAVAPLVLAFLALEFVAAMFARSFRELTFLTVFTSVLLTIYAFLPAVFTNVHPIAYVSPMTLVVNDIAGTAVTWGQIAYATLPLTVASAMLFILGAALYREEDLFHQKPVPAKVVDTIARQMRGLWSGFRVMFLLVPLVFIAELLLATFLFAWPVPTGLVTTLTAVALLEESFKAAPSYAAFTRHRVPAHRGVLFGALVGVGFFAAEKGFLLAGLAGLFDVPAATAVFVTSGGGAAAAGLSWPLILALLALPLALHAVTAAISGWGAAQGRRTFALAFATAVAVHATYNFLVVTLVGGGLP